MTLKKIIGLLLLSGLLILSVTPTYASVHVNGYFRKDGTYVQPHYRSNPDGNFNNNWSTKGNINPYTGQEGTKTEPDYSSGNNYDVEVPDFTTIPDTNKKLEEELRKQTEELNKQREESDKELDNLLKQLDDVGKDYTPPNFETSTNTDADTYTDTDTDTQNLTNSIQTDKEEKLENKKNVSKDHKKSFHSKLSLWDKFIKSLKGLFS
ncbi:hypothetical protein ACSU64_04300 [Bacillaceae bacterium C204]|uniref:hypothetical protein n=1 Tax=Neobacillus sp. 204 TaxID=3383351 RepID=UPI003979B552